MKHSYKTEGTCSTQIDFELEGETVHNVQFTSGCPGNLVAISQLVEGMTTQELTIKLQGIQCGKRGTSCADQLAKAVGLHRSTFDVTGLNY